MQIELKDLDFNPGKTSLDASFNCPGGCYAPVSKPALIGKTENSIKFLLPYPQNNKEYGDIMKEKWGLRIFVGELWSWKHNYLLIFNLMSLFALNFIIWKELNSLRKTLYYNSFEDKEKAEGQIRLCWLIAETGRG